MTQTAEQAVSQQEVEAFVQGFQKDQESVRKAAAGYQNSAVSASCSVGPDGANMQGWITYTASGIKIHFEASGKLSFKGLFGGGGALALIGAIDPERLAGKTGRFRASGSSGGGTIELWLDGQPVLTMPIPVVGAGVPFLPWSIEGAVRFDRRD